MSVIVIYFVRQLGDIIILLLFNMKPLFDKQFSIHGFGCIWCQIKLIK